MAKKKKDNFFESSLCESGNVCDRCRTFADYRKALDTVYDIPDIDRDSDYAFKCPKGKVSKEFEKTEFPTALGMMKSLGATAVAQVKHIARTRSVGMSSTKTQEARINTCKACDLYYARSHRCKQCGCRLKAKIRLAAAACPINKWGPESA